MLNQFSRTQLLLGAEAMEKLKGARVAVFGIGGVGGYVCEGLVRSGVGAFDLVDDDKVCLTNLNRQIIATRKTVGKYKVDVMRERMLEINPDCDVRVHKCLPAGNGGGVQLLRLRLRRRRRRHRHGQGHAGARGAEGGRAHHQLHGRGQQARSLPLPRGGHL